MRRIWGKGRLIRAELADADINAELRPITKNIQQLGDVSLTLANEGAAVEAVFGFEFATLISAEAEFCGDVCNAFLAANDLFDRRQQLAPLEYADKLLPELRLLNIEIGNEAFLRRIREGNANLKELTEATDPRFEKIKRGLQAAMAYRASF